MGAYLTAPVKDKETFEDEGLGIKFGGGAMQGWRKTMEDAHIACGTLGGDHGVALFGVFDGHGGSEVAKFCQRYITQEFLELEEKYGLEEALSKVFHRMDDMLRDSRFQEEIEELKIKVDGDKNRKEVEVEDLNGSMDALDLLKRVFQLKRYANGESNEIGAPEPAVKNFGGLQLSEELMDSDDDMVQAGCTAIVAIKRGDQLYVANAGDSRGVLCRAGKAIPLSEDHRPAHDGERSRVIAAGGFLSEIGGVCRVNGNLNLSRAIGDLRYKRNKELEAKDQIITAHPDICRILLTPEDSFFILACDGVWDVMSNQEVVDFISAKLEEGLSPSKATCALLDRCLADDPKESRGAGCDNMTALVVQLTHRPNVELLN